MKKGTWKTRLLHEVFEYWIIFGYLALVFAAFTQYRRLILAVHEITYTHYGIAMIKAAVLAKVVMIGGVARLGHGLERRPLIYATLYKTVLFSLLVGVFSVIEHGIKGLWKGTEFVGGIADYFAQGSDELLANVLIVFAAFIPFFAFRELGRVVGVERIRALFFRGGADPPTGQTQLERNATGGRGS